MANRNTFSSASTPPTSGNDFMDNVAGHIKKFYDASAFMLTSIGGTANSVTASLDPVLDGDGLVNGMAFRIVWAATNTAALEISINGGTAVPVKTNTGEDLPAGTTSSGLVSELIYYDGSLYMVSLSSVFIGDSGAGGVPGLVPAPAAGDGAASKVLLADGSWGVISGGGAPIESVSGTNVAALDVSLSGGYKHYRVIGSVLAISNMTGAILVSSNGGSSFLTTGYQNYGWGGTSANAIFENTTAIETAQISDTTFSTTLYSNFVLDLFDVNDAAIITTGKIWKMLKGSGSKYSSRLWRRSSAHVVTDIRVVMSSGNVTGEMHVFGIETS